MKEETRCTGNVAVLQEECGFYLHHADFNSC
jgi:hypothetical protein